MKRVGFWYHSVLHPDLPMPVAGEQEWEGNKNFLSLLTVLQIGMENDSRAKRNRYEDRYPDARVVQYKGMSQCRLCGQSNGSKEFTLGGFTWPEGYRHYLDEHRVEPDPEFKQFIKDWALNCVTIEGKPFVL